MKNSKDVQQSTQSWKSTNSASTRGICFSETCGHFSSSWNSEMCGHFSSLWNSEVKTQLSSNIHAAPNKLSILTSEYRKPPHQQEKGVLSPLTSVTRHSKMGDRTQQPTVGLATNQWQNLTFGEAELTPYCNSILIPLVRTQEDMANKHNKTWPFFMYTTVSQAARQPVDSRGIQPGD